MMLSSPAAFAHSISNAFEFLAIDLPALSFLSEVNFKVNFRFVLKSSSSKGSFSGEGCAETRNKHLKLAKKKKTEFSLVD